MQVIVIGAAGAVGRTAVQALAPRHEIITVGRSSGDVRADIADADEIRAMFEATGRVDAVVCAVGHGHFGPVDGMTADQFMAAIHHKLLPQVNVVLQGMPSVRDGGSFTLTSGVLNRDPIRGGASAAAANGAIDGFVRSASVEMPRGNRINVVSPGVLEAARKKYDGFFRGHVHVSDASVGLAYSKSVEGCLTGQVFTVG